MKTSLFQFSIQLYYCLPSDYLFLPKFYKYTYSILIYVSYNNIISTIIYHFTNEFLKDFLLKFNFENDKNIFSCVTPPPFVFGWSASFSVFVQRDSFGIIGNYETHEFNHTPYRMLTEDPLLSIHTRTAENSVFIIFAKFIHSIFHASPAFKAVILKILLLFNELFS